MSTHTLSAEAPPVVLHFGKLLRKWDEDEFFDFCQKNQNLRIERTSDGELILMTPTGGDTASFEFRLSVQFGNWTEADGSGIGFGPSAGFILPNGAERSPDLAWVRRSRWDALAPGQRAKFPPLCPDFVVEVRSRTDSLSELRKKMREYQENGASLGWLIDPLEKKVHIYRPGEKPVCLDNPESLSGDPVLPGLRIDLSRLWP
jgi:Uma2 family endonuclease